LRRRLLLYDRQDETSRKKCMRLLLIEDDHQLGHAVHQGLRDDYACDWFQNAEDGAEALRNEDYALLVLDVNLPGRSGLELLQALRREDNQIPVLLLTARDAPSQRVEGLDAGADDYLIKPFDFEELLARIRALLRRRGRFDSAVLTLGDLAINTTARTVSRAGKAVSLSAREYAILLELAEQAGRCLSKQQIEARIYDHDSDFESNTVEVHISAIRRKLGKDIIKTLRGVGYLMERSA
jgi:DNA-binding response OmpR family regulator